MRIRLSPWWALVLLGLFALSGGGEGHLRGEQPPLPRWERLEFHSRHMGTEFKILLYTKDAPAASEAAQEAFARIAALDRSFSDYDSESELMRLCDQAGKGPKVVSHDLWEIVTQAQGLHKVARGAFDITAAPVIRLWRRARRTRERPQPELLAEARAKVGMDQVVLSPPPSHPRSTEPSLLPAQAPTIALTRPGVKLDLGGIAKGYAVEAAFQGLRRRGLRSVLVAAAGDIRVGDPPPGRDVWEIAIASIDPKPEAQSPTPTPTPTPTKAQTSDPGPVLGLANQAVSTSGDTAQFVVIDGVRYSHIVDPRTGMALTRHGQVTVIAPTATLADGLATAVCVLGPDEGPAVLAQFPGTSARFVVATHEGEVVTLTPGFAVLLAHPPAGKP